MALAFSLSVGGVHFSITPSKTTSESDAPGISLRQIPQPGTESNGSTGKDTDFVLDLSNFSGTLRISKSVAPIRSGEEMDSTHLTEQFGQTLGLPKRDTSPLPTIDPLGIPEEKEPSPANGTILTFPISPHHPSLTQTLPKRFIPLASSTSVEITTTDVSTPINESFHDEPLDSLILSAVPENAEVEVDPSASLLASSTLSEQALERKRPPRRTVQLNNSFLSKSMAKQLMSGATNDESFLTPVPNYSFIENENDKAEQLNGSRVMWSQGEGHDNRRNGMSLYVPSEGSRRRNRTDDESWTETTLSQEVQSTPLHIACATPDITINELRALLHSHPSYVTARDAFGRTPLHLFANNEELALTCAVQDVQLFLEEMIVTDPNCLIITSIDGTIPFVDTISEWIDDLHTPGRRGSRVIDPGVSEEVVSHIQKTINTSSHGGRGEPSIVFQEKMFRFPIEVSTTRFFRWSLEMLSFCVTRLFVLSKENGRGLMPVRYMDCRQKVIESVASIPLLCKSILIITDNDESHRIFKLPIILNALLSRRSIGMWLVAMFRGDKLTKDRAINFLEHLSNVKVHELVGVHRQCNQQEFEQFTKKRNDTFNAVADLKGIMPAMVLLSPKKIERAATTPIVHFVLEKRIGKPSSLCFMLFDLTIYIFLMIGYRVNLVRCIDDSCRQREAPWYLTLLVASYFLCRDILTVISMAQTSRNQVKAFFRDWWNYVEFTSMVLVILTMSVLDSEIDDGFLPITFAMTIGLLWLKLIGFLKNINMQLSTFILAVVEILKDMRWFLLVLAVMISMFAEMIEILIKKSGTCEVVSDEGERRLSGTEDFCSSLAWDSYVRIYAIIVGDVNLEDFQATSAITILFIIFTLFGVIVLLNILIAIVNDSYAKSLTRSYGLFGKARVEYVSRQLAREDFVNRTLKPRANMKDQSCSDVTAHIFRHVIRIFIFTMLSAVVVTVNFLAVYTCVILMNERHIHNGEAEFLYGSLIGALLLFNAGLFAIILFSIGEIFDGASWLDWLKSISFLRISAALCLMPLRLFFRIIGMKGDAILGHNHSENNADDWSGRMTYLEEETRAIVGESEGRIRAEIRREIRALEDRERARIIADSN